MGLTEFHLVFISCATLLAGGCAAWGIAEYSRTGALLELSLGLVSLAAGALLARYALWFRTASRDLPGGADGPAA
jgi:hypothetical protein